jgi:hypothetical protein
VNAVRTPSILSLRLDVITARLLVWVASVGRDGALTDEAHRYFVSRYLQLAAHHRQRGHLSRAMHFEEKARRHGCSGGDRPPRAAAMGRPRPKAWIITDAIGRAYPHRPDDAA